MLVIVGYSGYVCHCYEICEQSEAFTEEEGDLDFHHTKIVLRHGNEFFYAISNRRLLQATAVDLNPSQLIRIPTENVWPAFEPVFTPAPEPLPVNRWPAVHLLSEATVCEILKKHPHPNIARYLGCVVEGGRIKVLCFVKYAMTLCQMVRDRTTPLDVDKCMRGIEDGVQHLHGLGLIHNDLNPSNIMMDRENAVIIDFDPSKAGTIGWQIGNSTHAMRVNDLFALSKIRGFLIQEQPKRVAGNQPIDSIQVT
ncbi:hypothetical protein BKA56DRAFT_632339 [Ilyonectria sp. MPI-CAGE-AT-0026]|nr:hypothetical protein BKA56DRAFT_632339 [Ilyonectria sp. MPI-CAGE-AT-0026]